MGTNIPLDKAELLGTLLEAILYGFSLLMFGATIWVLWSRWSTHQVNRIMLVIACSLLLLSTVHLIIDIIRIMEALILSGDTYPGEPVKFLSDVSQWTFVSKNYVYTVQSLIGDGVILYRCYMVWQSKLIIFLPALLWCAAGVAGIGAAVQASQNSFFDEVLVRWVTAFYATTFATNILTTFLLAYRIWYIDQKSARLRGHQNSQLRKTLHIIIDAGAIYNLTLLAAWICFSRQSYGQFVVQDMIVPIIAISFYMVIICVGLANPANLSAHGPPPRHSSTRDSFCADARNRMQVHITTLTENKVDSCQSLPISPITVVGGKNRRTPSEIKFDDTGDAV